MKPYYQDSMTTLYLGDCVDVIGKEVKKVDCLITDPPYFTPATISSTRRKLSRSLGNTGVFQSWMKLLAEKIEGILSPSSHYYIFCDGRSYPFIYTAFYEMSRDSRNLVWDKGRALLGRTWRRQHELILFGIMPEGKSIDTGDGDIILNKMVGINDRSHPAEKPVELLERLILKSTNENDIVFDPFCGTGSSGVACKINNRKYIGCDISEDFINIAKDRILNVNKKLL